MMEEALPNLLRELRQRKADAQRELSPADARELIVLDTKDEQLAQEIETKMLLQKAQQTPVGTG